MILFGEICRQKKIAHFIHHPLDALLAPLAQLNPSPKLARLLINLYNQERIVNRISKYIEDTDSD